MSWRDAISNVATLGGHQRLQAAQAEYADVHGRYLLKLESERASRARLQDAVTSLGSLTIKGFKCLGHASKLAATRGMQPAPPVRNARLPVVQMPMLPDFDRIEKLAVRYSEVQNAAGGLGAGSVAAIGSWSVVSLLGTASTGTAISTLSGVAATNATLAWLGGGALAAGGAGMAGGATLLGGIVIVPAIGIMSWQSRAKAEKLTTETSKIKAELVKLAQAIKQHMDTIVATTAATDRLASPTEALASKYLQVRRELFPIWYISYAIRKVRSWFGGEFFRTGEVTLLDELCVAIANYEAVWRSGQCNPHPSGSNKLESP